MSNSTAASPSLKKGWNEGRDERGKELEHFYRADVNFKPSNSTARCLYRPLQIWNNKQHRLNHAHFVLSAHKTGKKRQHQHTSPWSTALQQLCIWDSSAQLQINLLLISSRDIQLKEMSALLFSMCFKAFLTQHKNPVKFSWLGLGLETH